MLWMKPAWLSPFLRCAVELVTCPSLKFCFRNVQKYGFVVQIQLRTQHAIKWFWLQHSSTTQNKFDFPHKMCLICGLNINRSGWKRPSGGHLVHLPIPWDYQLSEELALSASENLQSSWFHHLWVTSLWMLCPPSSHRISFPADHNSQVPIFTVVSYST